ncbi:MAG: permease [Planctomycetota bacterium]|jgi:uncharacterized membrane protein YraQ (UPF0718 family)
MNRRSLIKLTGLVSYLAFIAVSAVTDSSPGKGIGSNFVYFWADLIKVLPFAFVLIGLFEVWVSRETVERHLGEESRATGYLWALVLSGITVGGVFVAFPVAYSLHKKGAALGVIFTYIGASAVCRVPMNLFELSFMGLKFTAIRLGVSLPLVVFSSVLLGRYLKEQNYELGSCE